MDEALAVTRLRAAGCVFAEEEARLIAAAAGTPGELAAMVERRAAGLPLEQVIGWADFCGLRIAVEPGVFVPRLRTEFLVREAVRLIHAHTPGRPGFVVVDLCCGTGAIAAAIAAAVPGAEVHAADLDPAAVHCARRNVPGPVYQGDLYAPLPARLHGRVTILAANVPYVPTAEISFLPPEARTYEPLAALNGGPDGLDVLRRVAAGAPEVAGTGGSSAHRDERPPGPGCRRRLRRRGLTPRIATGEDLDATVLIGTLGTSAGEP